MTIGGCQNSSKPTAQIIKKDFGLLAKENDSISIELILDQFKDYDELIYRAEDIVCNDSLPKITLKNKNKTKRIYFRNPCWEELGCLLIKQKNVIEIHNDTIKKSYERYFTLDSLPSVLKRDLENNGKDPSLCENPEKLLIYISYDKDGTKKLINTLNRLINAYEKVTDRTDLKIWLHKRLKIPPPPPMPENPDEMESE